jgi:hypothetical protein
LFRKGGNDDPVIQMPYFLSYEIWSVFPYYRLFTAQIPKAIVAMTPPKLKIKIGASPPSKVVPTRSPTFLAYRRRGPEH